MTKIFEWDARKGTILENVNKTSGVLTCAGVPFKKTEKGLATNFTTSDKLVFTFNHNLGERYYVFATKAPTSGTNTANIRMSTGSNFSYMGSNSLTLFAYRRAVANYKAFTIALKEGEWNHYVIYVSGDAQADTGNSRLWLNGVEITTSTTVTTEVPFAQNILSIGDSAYIPSNNNVLYLKIYKGLPNQVAIDREYRDFLQSQITEKPVRGFELVKPTDLSYLKDTGLVAAYNMKPNGNTLIDISGNNNNATIFDVVNTKRGLRFNGGGSTVITSMTANTYFAGGYTILARIKPISFGSSSFVRIVDKSENTSGANGFYLTLTSPALDIAYNDGTTIVKSTSSIIQLGQEQTIAMTMASNEIISFYHNGIAAGTESRAHNYITPAPLTIGNRAGATDRAFDGEIIDIRIYSRVLTLQELKNYHNSFIKPVILEDWSNYAVGNTMPNEWIINSGAFVIAETTTRKYLACTSNGTIRINYPTTNTSVYASIEYYDGTSWITYTGLLSALISTHAWLNLTGGYLVFTLTTSTRLGNIKIFDGVRV